jgi:hypothetical protein
MTFLKTLSAIVAALLQDGPVRMEARRSCLEENENVAWKLPEK